MATTSYSGSWGSSYGLNALRTCSLTGGGGASGIIGDVVVTLIHSTNAYSKSYDITVTLNFSDGTTKSVTETIKMTADNYSSYSYDYTFTGLTVSQANGISSVSVQCTGGSSGYSSSNVYVKSSASVVVNYTVPSKCGAPSISVSSTKTTNSTVTVSWTPGSSGTANTLTGYLLQYRDSTDGSTWGDWTQYGTYSTSTSSVSASLPAAKGYRQFRVCSTGSQGSSYYSDWSTSSSVVRVATPTAPSNVSAVPATWENGNVTITWDASTVTGSSISRYYIEYSLKSYGGSYGTWTALANTTSLQYSYNPNLSKGDSIQYRVRAYSADEIYSAYSSAVTVARNTDTPINLTPAAGWYTAISACSWELPDAINLTGTYCQYCYTLDSGGTWSAWATASGSSFDASTLFASVATGRYFRYQVRAVQANGDTTNAAYSPLIYKNSAPAAPVVLCPAPATPTSPGAFWAVISVSTDPNGHAMTAAYSKDEGELVAIGSGLTAACVLAVKLSAGGVYRFRVMDEYGAYSETTCTITVAAETYTDNPVTAGTTRIKATHINELRSRIQQLCTLYGVTVPTWTEEIVAGTTSVKGFPSHISELRSALEMLYSKINSLGAGTVVASPKWAEALTDIKPKAAVIEELRAVARAI